MLQIDNAGVHASSVTWRQGPHTSMAVEKEKTAIVFNSCFDFFLSKSNNSVARYVHEIRQSQL